MPNSNGDQPKQKTQPKKGPPVEIPIPKRGDVFRDLGKVAKPRKKDSPAGESGPEDQV
jgi:hypothetical protein